MLLATEGIDCNTSYKYCSKVTVIVKFDSKIQGILGETTTLPFSLLTITLVLRLGLWLDT